MPGTDLFGSEEKKHVNDVLDTGCLFRYNHEHIRQGMWKARELEAEVCKHTGAQYAHAVSSGSTAVSSMLAAAGIGFGDEVIVPPFTYIAPIESVLLAGGLPVFAEVDETLCLSAEGIEKAITPNTKAVLLVHMCGAAADMEGIMAVCKKHKLKLVEDAGQAMGAFYKGTSVGLFGVAGSFSMDFFKITTAGEGGVCITNDQMVYDHMAQFSDHGHDHIGDNRGMEQHPILGINYRIGELNAAVGLAQMQKIDTILEIKKRNKARLRTLLQDIDGISFRHMPDPEGDSATFLNFFLPTQEVTEKAATALGQAGLGVAYWYTNMYHFINQWDHLKELRSPFKMAIHHLGAPQDYHNLELPKTQNVIGRLISVGISAKWTEAEIDDMGSRMAEVIKGVL